LPAIQSLREEGCFGPLESNASVFAGGVWPTFYTAKDVPWHGIYHNKLWRHENMRCEVAHDEWLSEKPFWEMLDREKYRIAAIDVPMTVGAPRPVNGIQLAGWGTHDLIVKGSWPADLWKKVKKEFGRPVMPPECFGPQSVKTLQRLQDVLLKATDQMVRLSESLLVQERWDLFLVVLGAAHRGGHYLWDLSQIDTAGPSSEVQEMLSHALVDIYQACDHAVGRLIEKAPGDARVLVFALHGMGPNPGWSDRCPEILGRIQQKGKHTPSKTGFLYKLRQILPWQLIRQVTALLPQEALNRLVSLWSARMFDWSTTRYFPVPMDLAGYIRINVKGRENEGIVEPGQEYESICKELEDAFLSFRDAATGEPLVERVYRMYELAPTDAPYRNGLPDLAVTWRDTSAVLSNCIRSEAYGEITWDTGGKLPSGRSGNHLGRGWFAARGDRIPPGARVEGYGILDLVPTVFHWLGEEPGPDFQGKSISDLCAE
jgi:predicted AlkP superfamily phosphohydrolase/phosphomutase